MQGRVTASRAGAGRAQPPQVIRIPVLTDGETKPISRRHKLTSRFGSKMSKGVLCVVTTLVLYLLAFARWSAPPASVQIAQVREPTGMSSAGQSEHVAKPGVGHVQTRPPVVSRFKSQCSTEYERSSGGQRPYTAMFAVQEYRRHECLRSVQQKLVDGFRPYFEKYPGGVALIDVALHANLGDNILWRGAIALLAQFKISPGVVCFLSQPSAVKAIDVGFPLCKYDHVLDIVRNKGLVLLHAGGNWGDLYRFVQQKRLDWMKKLSRDANEYGFGILQLPQTIYYTPNSKWLNSDVDALYGYGRGAFTLFVRDRESYDFAVKHYNNTDVRLVPDIAFAIGPISTPCAPAVDILIHARYDREAREKISDMTWVNEKIGAANLTYRIQDWEYKHEDHPREFSSNAHTVLADVRVSAASEFISTGKVVITNRLHGSIVASLIGKHLIYVDTKENKIAHVRTNSFYGSEHCSPENLHSHRMDNMRNAVDFAINVLQSSGSELSYI